MALTNSEAYRRVQGGWRKWALYASDDGAPSRPHQNGRSTTVSGTAVRLTRIPERHATSQTGHMILGPQGATKHSGTTFRATGWHTHELDSDGERMHVPAKNPNVPSDNDGVIKARKTAQRFRGVRHGKRNNY